MIAEMAYASIALVWATPGKNVSRITGQSKRKHMLLHPRCKKSSKVAFQHPLIDRPLIVEALPLELQN